VERAYGEQLGAGVLPGAPEFDQVRLLGGLELGLLAAQSALALAIFMPSSFAF